MRPAQFRVSPAGLRRRGNFYSSAVDCAVTLGARSTGGDRGDAQGAAGGKLRRWRAAAGHAGWPMHYRARPTPALLSLYDRTGPRRTGVRLFAGCARCDRRRRRADPCPRCSACTAAPAYASWGTTKRLSIWHGHWLTPVSRRAAAVLAARTPLAALVGPRRQLRWRPALTLVNPDGLLRGLRPRAAAGAVFRLHAGARRPGSPPCKLAALPLPRRFRRPAPSAWWSASMTVISARVQLQLLRLSCSCAWLAT